MERFPATRHSAVQAARSEDRATRERAVEALVGAYYKPVHAYLRAIWRLDGAEADDLAQGFFTRAVERGLFAQYDDGKARLRTYLRACVDRFVLTAREAEGRQKRGGGATHVELDGEAAELAGDAHAEEVFRSAWVRALVEGAVAELAERCEAAGRPKRFRVFERYDVDGEGRELTYAEIGRDLGLEPAQVTNELAAARRDFRAIVIERLRAITGSEEELRAEARALFGREP